VFVLGGLVVRQIPFLEEQVSTVLDHADQGSGPLLVLVTAVNGVAEELFFRGAAYAAIPRHRYRPLPRRTRWPPSRRAT
jgi:membrane protease YdiL (CAAX protease family)